MTQIFNRKDELEKRRQLRNNAPEAEVRLWKQIKGQQVGECKFRRQYSVGPYVLDFYCPARKLAIEVDGSSHDGEDAQEYDVQRQRYVEALGIHFVRFSNADVYDNLEGVITVIESRLAEQPPLAPPS